MGRGTPYAYLYAARPDDGYAEGARRQARGENTQDADGDLKFHTPRTYGLTLCWIQRVRWCCSIISHETVQRFCTAGSLLLVALAELDHALRRLDRLGPPSSFPEV